MACLKVSLVNIDDLTYTVIFLMFIIRQVWISLMVLIYFSKQHIFNISYIKSDLCFLIPSENSLHITIHKLQIGTNITF